MTNRTEIYKKWISLYNSGEIAKLKAELMHANPADLAEFFEDQNKEIMVVFFRLLTKDQAAETFSYMDSDLQEHIVKAVTGEEVRGILSELSIDDTVDFLNEMPANIVKKILMNTDQKIRETINEFLNYPDDSAGSIMTIEFMQFHLDATVASAMAQIKQTGLDKETIYTCYVTDGRKVLLGVVALKDIILNSDDTKIEDIMDDEPVYIHTLDDQEKAARLFKKYDLIALPVVDNEKRLVGIITVDDIVDVIVEEDTEDIEKMSALIPAEDEYLKTSVIQLSKNRMMWLLLLMISGTISSAIITGYESILAAEIALSAFFTILMDTGGNAGSQSSTLIIRGMALGEIELKDVFRVLWKEIRVGMVSGTVLALVNFGRLMLIKADLYVNLTVSVSLFFTVIVAKSLGGILPMAAKKIKVDPAIMAGPLITTIVDAVSLVIFFNLAKAFVL